MPTVAASGANSRSINEIWATAAPEMPSHPTSTSNRPTSTGPARPSTGVINPTRRS